MHAYISTDIWDYMKNVITTCMHTSLIMHEDVVDNDRLVRSPIYIMFTPETTFHEVLSIDSSIRTMKFHMLQLQQIYEDSCCYVEDTTFAIGMIYPRKISTINPLFVSNLKSFY